MEPRGQELVARYKANYSIFATSPVTEEMILAHWELERQLTRELLASTPDNRWDTFDRCYTHLYRELDWLNRFSGESAPSSQENKLRKWRKAIGSPPQTIYEIGSGTATLITYLAQQGFVCTATEITRERGAKHSQSDLPHLTWSISDGVHLDQFEAAESYDVVFSDQVLEHFHPLDIPEHLQSAHRILKKSGRYILCTPHRFSGPHDVSRVFKCDSPCGMHLKEYTNREVIAALKLAGFGRCYYAFLPGENSRFKKILGIAYLQVLIAVEICLGMLPSQKVRRLCTKVLRKVGLFANNVSLIADKA